MMTYEARARACLQRALEDHGPGMEYTEYLRLWRAETGWLSWCLHSERTYRGPYGSPRLQASYAASVGVARRRLVTLERLRRARGIPPVPLAQDF